ncbi:hypothetical protein [Nonomuraea sp. NPDC049758]|uniref:hypothetical protein n=1 Tax=Nonomuraea sp. NPDC049758 TaxID=3154360 RepID=UPI0034486411
MADDTENHSSDVLLWIWAILGLIVGLVLSVKYAQSAGITREEKLPTTQGLFLVGLMFGPAILSFSIGDHFHKEVHRGRMSWEVYWTVLSGLAASTFAFLGITGVDELLEVWKYLSS